MDNVGPKNRLDPVDADALEVALCFARGHKIVRDRYYQAILRYLITRNPKIPRCGMAFDVLFHLTADEGDNL